MIKFYSDVLIKYIFELALQCSIPRFLEKKKEITEKEKRVVFYFLLLPVYVILVLNESL